MFKTEEKDFEIALCLKTNQLGILQNGVYFHGIVDACVDVGCAARSFEGNSETSKIGDPQGQILGKEGTKSVCIHKFDFKLQKYKISDPNGVNCGTPRYVDKSSVTYEKSAFGKWLVEVESGGMIKLDMRYAKDKIFPVADSSGAIVDHRIKQPLYGSGRCFLHPKAKTALEKADVALRQGGTTPSGKSCKPQPDLRLLMLDCYRPQYVSQYMWDLVPLPQFVAASGKSGHNRGGTVDLTLATLDTQKNPVAIDMGSAFDLFDTKKTPYLGQGLTTVQKENRAKLRCAMEASGWSPYDGEWWHFNSGSQWDEYLDLPI
jgi:zinc D-Ala-D-Ala dipeptidase